LLRYIGSSLNIITMAGPRASHRKCFAAGNFIRVFLGLGASILVRAIAAVSCCERQSI
jgi:hypothetical protein